MTDSPVNQILKNILIINKNDTTAIYIQIAQQFIQAIQIGTLQIGDYLPGTRLLSTMLNIHRNTAVKIYDELASQGWVKIAPNKGTFVISNETKTARITRLQNLPTGKYPTKAGFNFTENTIITSPYEKATTTYTFNDGQPDIRLFEKNNYKRWYTEALRKTSVLNKWDEMLHDSNQFFLTQLNNYLNITRKFHVGTANILATRNTEMSLYLITKVLIKPKDVILVGNLCNFSANMIFQQAGALIKTIPIATDGLDIDFIRKNFTKNKIKALYCNPQRHYPTTQSMSIEKRLALLKLAKEYNFAIIEDDFDFDLQFNNYPLPPLISNDENGNVIYLGHLGNILFPALESGFIVAPENFIKEVRNYLKMIDRQGDFVKEQVIGEMILEGELNRHLKKLRLIYKKRKEIFTTALIATFEGIINVEIPTGGLAVFITFKEPINLLEFKKILNMHEVTIPQHLLYQTKDVCGIRLGYGHLNEEEIVTIISLLKRSFLQLK